MLIIQENISLQSLNTFRIPARARWFCEICSEQDLQELVGRLAEFPRYMVLGSGSNVLFGGDYHGLIILNRIGGSRLENIGQGCAYHLGAGENWHSAVHYSVRHNYYGLENLSLIPGTVGAAPIQNIGAYGVELKDAFISLKAMDLQSGQWTEFCLDDCRFDYRDSVFKQEGAGRYCIASVALRLEREASLKTGYGEIATEIDRRGWQETNMSPLKMSEVIMTIRQRKLPDPAKLPNAGSFFKNPIISAADFEVLRSRFPDIASYPAGEGRIKLACGWLIDRLGWKGRSLDGAKVHDQQALVLINEGGGAAAIKALACRIQAEVLDTYGVRLEPEPVWVE